MSSAFEEAVTDGFAAWDKAGPDDPIVNRLVAIGFIAGLTAQGLLPSDEKLTKAIQDTKVGSGTLVAFLSNAELRDLLAHIRATIAEETK